MLCVLHHTTYFLLSLDRTLFKSLKIFHLQNAIALNHHHPNTSIKKYYFLKLFTPGWSRKRRFTKERQGHPKVWNWNFMASRSRIVQRKIKRYPYSRRFVLRGFFFFCGKNGAVVLEVRAICVENVTTNYVLKSAA